MHSRARRTESKDNLLKPPQLHGTGHGATSQDRSIVHPRLRELQLANGLVLEYTVHEDARPHEGSPQGHPRHPTHPR